MKKIPLGICDVGSNTVRFVVYAERSRAPEVRFNDRTLCRLGRTLAATGRLDAEGKLEALAALKRYQRQARRLGVMRFDVLCTAAIREAEDGPAFLRRIRVETGLRPKVISGTEEAELAAFGVLYGMPGADGVLGDLGGGSLELVNLAKGKPGTSASLPLGALRYFGLSLKEASARMEEGLARAKGLSKLKGRPFIALGGSWRTLAKLYMRETHYPLEVVDGFGVKPTTFARFLEELARMPLDRLEQRASWVGKRLDSLPYAALLLALIIRRYAPSRVVFSAGGVREGALYARLSASERKKDALLEVCQRRTGRQYLKRQPRALPGNRLAAAAVLLKAAGTQPDEVLTMEAPTISHAERVVLYRALGGRRKISLKNRQ